jgi:sortase A
MKKVIIAIGGLVCMVLVVVAIRWAAPQAVAEAEHGLSPFTAFPLNPGRNTGILAPGESRWYELGANPDGAFQRQADLTFFFTPDDGNRAYRVSFQIFPSEQIMRWYSNDVGQMQNMGAGGVVSRDGNPVTGELLWSGWVANDQAYFIQVSNGADVPIDYWLFTDNVMAAELGPSTDPALAEAAPSAPPDQPPAAPPPEVSAEPTSVSEPLLPLASESQGNAGAMESGAGDVPAGTPTRLIVPSVALDSQIIPVGKTAVVINGVAYGQWNTANDLVGWHDLSAKLGQAGNTVLNGHSDLNAAVFRNLDYVTLGDEIIVLSGDQAHKYVVTHKFLVREKDVSLEERIQNAAWVAPTPDERLTLVTCANPGASHRLIIIAQPAPAGG